MQSNLATYVRTLTIINRSLPCFTWVSVLSLLITCSYFTTIPSITILNIRSSIAHICLTSCIIRWKPCWQLPLVHTHGMCVERIALMWSYSHNSMPSTCHLLSLHTGTLQCTKYGDFHEHQSTHD